MAQDKLTTVDGYIRVSRRAGREGESFISPEVQRQRISGWAEANGVELLRWWEELDQSGAKRNRPMFQEALARCERGETGGIVVAKLDRFARSAVDALESIKRLNDAGARLVSVEDGFDGSTPMGRFAIGILTLIAELELERIRDNWQTAVSEAVGRGVHISARVPTGYERDESGRLQREEPAASVIAEAFRKRATGTSFRELADFLDAKGVRPSSGSPHWSTQGVGNLIRNRVYLGEARSGKIVNARAHEPIVSQAEYDAAQRQTTLLKPRDGSLAVQAMLGGLMRCAGCGHTLKITGSTDKTGNRAAVYYCIGRYAKGLCPARASVRASVVDQYVEREVLRALSMEGGLVAEAVAASAELEQARQVVEAAEHELDQYLAEPLLLTTLGRDRFLEGAAVRRRALEQAQAELDQLHARSELADQLLGGDLLANWPSLNVQEKRRLLHGLLEQVVLRRSEGRGRATPPIETRTTIILRGGTPLTVELGGANNSRVGAVRPTSVANRRHG
jgi:DNA invertase Pin-like site-specific DNA recombinase